MTLYQYPPSTVVNRVIPKKRLYEQGNANSKLKQRFVDEVEQIVWAYKLSADTLNIEAIGQLKEVQIFRIIARTANLDINIIKYIDKLIPIPIIFEVAYEDKVKVVASYKRVSQADKSKTVLNKYYASSWQADHPNERAPLPFVLNLSDLYSHLIEQLLPDIGDKFAPSIDNRFDKYDDSHQENSQAHHQVLPNVHNPTQSPKRPRKKIDIKVDIEAKLKHVQQVESLQKQIAQLQKRVNKEAQFNRQVTLNMQLHKLKNKLNQLIG